MEIAKSRVLPIKGKPEGCWTIGSSTSLLTSNILGLFSPPVSYVITSLVGKTLSSPTRISGSNSALSLREARRPAVRLPLN